MAVLLNSGSDREVKGLESELIVTIVNVVLVLVSCFAGAKWALAKSKAKQLTTLLSKITVAAEDDAVSDDEFQGIVAAAKALIDSS